jgi:beta-barrel assembly-enhancing protease
MKIRKSIVFTLVALTLTACGINPVTGEREMQFVSEAQEIQIGEQSYAPSRQAEGGEMEVMPELTAYINEVGQKLAAVADRKLPYEFKVLNNSVPNAWAMPGGKIAVNRGLLTELKNESELAAVLGHEIVHAAARHGAKAQERGTLMQVGMVAAQVGAVVGGVDADVAGMALAGAGVGLQMTQMKYGRDQELQSDFYGMQYMQRAGYDLNGAITLQETFVRLSSGHGEKENAFEQLFASHPPSPERVAKNKVTAATLGVGGEVGEQRYQTRIAALTKAKPAYDKFDQAVAALKKKEFSVATSLANEANQLLPDEGRFHELLGEIALSQKHFKEAIPHYQKAIQLNPNYFGSYLGGGIAQYQSGNKPQAQQWLKRSNELLPTKPAAEYLARIAESGGAGITTQR